MPDRALDELLDQAIDAILGHAPFEESGPELGALVRIASALSDQDRAVAAESGGGTIQGTGRTGELYRLRLVAHEQETFHRFYNEFANKIF